MERHITLVAGGAGFIGSHLCMRLLAEGHNVIAMDNLSTGRLSNIAEISNSPNFTFIRHDITVPYTLTYKIDSYTISHALHLHRCIKQTLLRHL